MITIDEFIAGFGSEPGYLDYAKVGPLATTVVEEEHAQLELLRIARFGSFSQFESQDARVRAAVATLTGFRDDQIVFQPNTSMGLMHAMFGIRGGVLLSRADFPSGPFAAVRSAEALGELRPVWLDADYGRVTPGTIQQHLTDDVSAVAVSLVDFRTGHVVDLEGIRQVVGDRLLIVDAIQGFGVVDAPFHLADVVASGGQKWIRAGWGTGFLALSDRATDQLTPVLSGFNATDDGPMPLDRVPPPGRGAHAYQVSDPSPMAQARLAAALEQLIEVGVPAVSRRVSEQVERVIEIADRFGVPVSSPRHPEDRAGIVVLAPAPDQVTVLVASLHNHGVTVSAREGSVRLSVHAATSEETFAMLRASLQSFVSATSV